LTVVAGMKKPKDHADPTKVERLKTKTNYNGVRGSLNRKVERKTRWI